MNRITLFVCLLFFSPLTLLSNTTYNEPFFDKNQLRPNEIYKPEKNKSTPAQELIDRLLIVKSISQENPLGMMADPGIALQKVATQFLELYPKEFCEFL